ncbi:peptidoglycan-associated lipoprotein Pal [Piscinibacter sp.]|uniref:peptidoglycan-associated lipoprotein Pal n=1 Tax=Piscinibacter sp. TaxID=1903157 RepID=UPI002CFD62E3|nr:peptidoglycan-associated lipoprotein Pal [Albitalea sp.]HUG21929.1 peptidoglycan-associated lipoprotein Pal [Albitalea sp.]
MNMMRTTAAGLWILGAAALVAGCGSSVNLDEKQPPVESRTPSTVQPGAGTAGTSQSAVTSVDLTKNDASARDELPRIVYFDFDSFVVKDEFRPTVEAHAKNLARDRAKKLAIEGHTDERGGREYNLALGQKRAEAVAKSLVLLGANADQLEAVSFGKERPAVAGSDEAAWAENRRAELVSR